MISPVTLKNVCMMCFLLIILCASVARGEEASDPVQAENAFFRGSHLLSRESISEAVDALEKAVKLDPKNAKYKSVLAVAYNNLGLRLNREANYRDALRFLSNAMEMAPDDNDIRANFVQAAVQAASAPEEKIRTDDKIAALKRVVELEPENASARKVLAALVNNAGVTKGKTGSHQQEVEELEKALSLDPENPR